MGSCYYHPITHMRQLRLRERTQRVRGRAPACLTRKPAGCSACLPSGLQPPPGAADSCSFLLDSHRAENRDSPLLFENGTHSPAPHSRLPVHCVTGPCPNVRARLQARSLPELSDSAFQNFSPKWVSLCAILVPGIRSTMCLLRPACVLKSNIYMAHGSP